MLSRAQYQLCRLFRSPRRRLSNGRAFRQNRFRAFCLLFLFFWQIEAGKETRHTGANVLERGRARHLSAKLCCSTAEAHSTERGAGVCCVYAAGGWVVWLLMLMLSRSLVRSLSVFCYVAGGLCCESASGRMSNRAKECGRVSVDDCTQKGVVIFFGNYKKFIF